MTPLCLFSFSYHFLPPSLYPTFYFPALVSSSSLVDLRSSCCYFRWDSKKSKAKEFSWTRSKEKADPEIKYASALGGIPLAFCGCVFLHYVELKFKDTSSQSEEFTLWDVNVSIFYIHKCNVLWWREVGSSQMNGKKYYMWSSSLMFVNIMYYLWQCWPH